MKKQNIICFINNKGGVGKTTITLNLGLVFAKDTKTLLIDMDPQANLSKYFHVHKSKYTVIDTMLSNHHITECIVKLTDMLWILPSSMNLSKMEGNQYGAINPYHCLEQCLQPIYKEFDFILIDNAPFLGTLTKNSIFACNHIIIPIVLEPFGLMGISGVNTLLDEIRVLHEFKILGVLINHFDQRKSTHKVLLSSLEESNKMNFFSTKIRTNSLFAKHQMQKSMDLLKQDKKGLMDFLELKCEVLGRIYREK